MNQKADIRAEIIEDLLVLNPGTRFSGQVADALVRCRRVADALLGDEIRHVKVVQVIESPGHDALKCRIRALEKMLDELCDEVECDGPGADRYLPQPLIDKIYDARALLLKSKPVEPDPETRRQQEALAAEHEGQMQAESDGLAEEARIDYGLAERDRQEDEARAEMEAIEENERLGEYSDVEEDRMGYR